MTGRTVSTNKIFNPLTFWWGKSTAETAMNLAGAITLLFLSILLVMLLAGDRFAESLSYLGLYNQKDGLFVNCALPGNEKKRFCQPPVTHYDRQWKAIYDRVPFSLSGN